MARRVMLPPNDPAMERVISRIMTCAPLIGCKHEKDCFHLARHLRDWYRWYHSQNSAFHDHPAPYQIQEMGVPVVWIDENEDDDYALYAHQIGFQSVTGEISA